MESVLGNDTDCVLLVFCALARVEKSIDSDSKQTRNSPSCEHRPDILAEMGFSFGSGAAINGGDKH